MTGPRLSIIPADAAEDAAVSAPAYRLLGLLAAHADKSGYCFPSVGRLAKKMRTSERWVQKLLFALSATPYLNATRRPGRSTVYQIVTKGVNQEFTPEPVVHPRTSSSPGGEPVVRKGVNQEFTHNDTKNDKPNDTRANDQFEQFWKTYPSRGDNKPNPKKPAREKFLAAVKKGTDPADISFEASKTLSRPNRRTARSPGSSPWRSPGSIKNAGRTTKPHLRSGARNPTRSREVWRRYEDGD